MQKWLKLYENTFIWVKGSQGLIYNASNFKNFNFNLTNEIEYLCKEFSKPDNLYSVRIFLKLLKNKFVIEWIRQIETIEAGILLSVRNKHERPVSFPPLLRIYYNR